MACRLRSVIPALQQCSRLASYSGTKVPESIEVAPLVSLFDQKVDIRVRGLPCVTKVTLQLVTCQVWRKTPVEFMSCGHYVTSPEGDLQLHRDASLGGTYSGLEPMGLFWSLKPSPAGAQNIRMVIRNGDDPVLYTLSVYPEHMSLEDLVSADVKSAPLCSTTVERLKRSADVTRTPVREGSVRGTLFLPGGEGPHPGVIDMFGSAGGLMEIRASLLASKGFAVLALPFFKYEDLPSKLDDITFDYFEEAVTFLSSHKAVKGEGIGVVSISTGAQFAALMAVHCPPVKVVVRMNGPSFFWLNDCTRKNGELLRKGLKMRADKAIPTPEGLAIRDCFPYETDDIIPLWETSAHVLSLASGDDYQLHGDIADVLYSMYPEDKRHLMEVVHYPGAGHLLEPPYSPFCRACENPTFGVDMLWGGNMLDHVAAQEDSWHRIINFLKKHLC